MDECDLQLYWRESKSRKNQLKMSVSGEQQVVIFLLKADYIRCYNQSAFLNLVLYWKNELKK